MEVVRIIFLKVKQIVRRASQLLEITQEMLTDRQPTKVFSKVLAHLARFVLSWRLRKSCSRAPRQPVSSWPRLACKTYKSGQPEYQILLIKPQLP